VFKATQPTVLFIRTDSCTSTMIAIMNEVANGGIDQLAKDGTGQ
jgi:hypothetical protein